MLQIRKDQRLRREQLHVRRVDGVGEGRQGLFPSPVRLPGPRYVFRWERQLFEDDGPPSRGHL